MVAASAPALAPSARCLAPEETRRRHSTDRVASSTPPHRLRSASTRAARGRLPPERSSSRLHAGPPRRSRKRRNSPILARVGILEGSSASAHRGARSRRERACMPSRAARRRGGRSASRSGSGRSSDRVSRPAAWHEREKPSRPRILGHESLTLQPARPTRHMSVCVPWRNGWPPCSRRRLDAAKTVSVRPQRITRPARWRARRPAATGSH